jgi:diacylglycerol kinase (ATP)
MRAAAILGLGSSSKNLKPFQINSQAEWMLGLPASSNDADVVLIFGGDGTVHRHLGALVHLKLPVLVVPCGSGNDFAQALGLSSLKKSLAAWKKFVAGEGTVREIDLGLIRPLDMQLPRFARNDNQEEKQPSDSRNSKLETRNSTYFCCAGGAGLDAQIARRANRIPRWLRGHGGYLLSMLPALAKFTPTMTRISVSGDSAEWQLKSAARTFVAVFANTPRYGGGMKIAPGAQLDDGLLDVCMVSEIDKLKLFCLFPTVYFGHHLNVPEVEYFQTPRMRIETDEPLDVYADGEFVCQTPIEVSVAVKALKVLSTEYPVLSRKISNRKGRSGFD